MLSLYKFNSRRIPMRGYLSATIKGYLRLKINLFILFITFIIFFTLNSFFLLIPLEVTAGHFKRVFKG